MPLENSRGIFSLTSSDLLKPNTRSIDYSTKLKLSIGLLAHSSLKKIPYTKYKTPVKIRRIIKSIKNYEKLKYQYKPVNI
jgi:hypothetical protein